MTEAGADILGFTLCTVDHRLIEVYGVTLHCNDGWYLADGVAKNSWWQWHWLRLVADLAAWYNIPNGKVRNCFVAILAAEFKGCGSGNGIWSAPFCSAALSWRRSPACGMPRIFGGSWRGRWTSGRGDATPALLMTPRHVPGHGRAGWPSARMTRRLSCGGFMA